MKSSTLFNLPTNSGEDQITQPPKSPFSGGLKILIPSMVCARVADYEDLNNHARWEYSNEPFEPQKLFARLKQLLLVGPQARDLCITRHLRLDI